MMLLFPTWIAPSLATCAVMVQLCLRSAKKPAPSLAPSISPGHPGLAWLLLLLLPPERINQFAPSPPLPLKPPAT